MGAMNGVLTAGGGRGRRPSGGGWDDLVIYNT